MNPNWPEAFKNADMYDAIDNQQLHHTDPIEALEEAVDQWCTSGCDVSAVIREHAPFKITAYSHKEVSEDDYTGWTDRLIEFMSELFGDEYGDPDGSDYDEISREAIEKAHPKFEDAIKTLLDGANVWACDEVATVLLEAEEVEALVVHHDAFDMYPRPTEEDDEDGTQYLTLDEFIEQVKLGVYNDFDGYGVYATETHISNKIVYPSGIARGEIDRSFTHIAWYNK